MWHFIVRKTSKPMSIRNKIHITKMQQEEVYQAITSQYHPAEWQVQTTYSSNI